MQLTHTLRCGSRTLDLATPRVMGVLNITPDSFSDGGRFCGASGPRLDRILRSAERMQAAGASILDIGGESTRPGALAIGPEEELARIAPVLEALRARFDLVLSIDTRTPAVMRAAIALGADMINDICALAADGALAAVRDAPVAVCLMHMQGEPRSMQQAPVYADVGREVGEFLLQRAAACVDAGIARERLLIDPGFGFGKTLAHNLQLFNHLPALAASGWPVLVGVSRKSMIGQLTGRAPRLRVAGGLALATLALQAGVRIIRTHDVAGTVDALKLVLALRQAEMP